MQKKFPQKVFLTGGTAGIAKASTLLDRKGYEVFITRRNLLLRILPRLFILYWNRRVAIVAIKIKPLMQFI